MISLVLKICRPMIFGLALLLIGSVSRATEDTGIKFNQEMCVAQMKNLGARNSDALCALHALQFPQAKLLKTAIYSYSYTLCSHLTGELSRYSINSVPCVKYNVESEFQKEYVILNLFGRTARAPLNFKGLYINISIVPRQLQMQ